MIYYVSLVLTELSGGKMVNFSQEISIQQANSKEEALGIAISRRDKDGKMVFTFAVTDIGSVVDELRKTNPVKKSR